jgi:hypothetical protein
LIIRLAIDDVAEKNEAVMKDKRKTANSISYEKMNENVLIQPMNRYRKKITDRQTNRRQRKRKKKEERKKKKEKKPDASIMREQFE